MVGFLNAWGRSAILLIALVVGVLFDVVALAARGIDVTAAAIIVRRQAGTAPGSLGLRLSGGIGGRVDIAGPLRDEREAMGGVPQGC